MKSIKNVWIDSSILYWSINGSIGCYNGEDIASCYEYWEYAETLINKFDDKFHLQDSIKNLKYVVDKRIKQIERIYDFKSYFPSKHILEIYEELGIVKGFVIKNLFELRNNIEHNEVEIDEKERCRNFLDTIWYFLKSTDLLVTSSNVENDFYKDIDNDDIVINIDVNTPKLEDADIRGTIEKSMISYQEKEDFIQINNVEINPWSDTNGKNKNIIQFKGKIVLTKKTIIELAKRIFINRID